MELNMKKIAVVGNGKIGSIIGKTLREQNFDVCVGDTEKAKNVDMVDASNFNQLRDWLSSFEVVLCATPYYLVPNVARAASELGIAYFDLTEDRDSTDYVKSLESNNVLVPQCGLAPGAVSVVISHLIERFDTVKSVDIRVGALPLHPNNNIQYYLTWSTNGLINEYCNLCEAIHNNKRIEVMPLEGYERISLDGQVYEAFNTSGGIGSLCESLDGRVEKLSYKTIRYIGHHHLMKFLLDDLNLSKNRELFIKLFDQEVPQTAKDVVIIMVKAIGYRGKKLFEESYFKKIYGKDGESAIQRSTVGGICAAMASWMTGTWGKTKGVVRQEEIDWMSFTNNIWGGIYRSDEETDW
jgi:saccharopine dehydrogenase-like NADP-dependent oxidoreductase